MRRADVTELSGSVGLGAWTAFGLLTLAVVGAGGAPLFLDDALHAWSLAHRPEVAVAVARALTATGTGVIAYLLAALAGVLVGRTPRQRLTGVALAVGCLASGQLLRYTVMVLVHRPRPPRQDWATHASGWAFPSGHATTATLTAGLLILALTVSAPRGGTALRVVVGCWGVLVGLTRVYLGVHWFTDVVGGWLFGLGWLGLYLCAMSRWLPAGFLTRPPSAAPEHPGPHTMQEDHEPPHPGRRGRSRPA
ncbi:phosphatase PAP2 family protein [Streptomyces adustus]